VRIIVNLLLSKKKNLSNWKTPERSFANSDRVIQPSAELRQGSSQTISPTDLPPNEEDAFLYVWGLVTYTDAFGEQHFTRYVHRYNTASREARDGKLYIDETKARYQGWGNNAN
jgi:hypothetical protein